MVSVEMYAGYHSRWIDVKIKFVEWMGLSLGTHFPDDQPSKFMLQFQPGASSTFTQSRHTTYSF